jgi:hypothetical protein
MLLEAYIWCWINLHPFYVLRRVARLLGLAALIILPLLYVNADLVRKGFNISPPRTHIQASQTVEDQTGDFDRR